ncbi:circadian clock KaiB family protein [Leptolyngbya ohadii]|uniref:circadian clock KaiB family protein n=1 Tax=Leptolyngbya ohadii TaxID=1962290 RepID=UPI000B5A210F|nr:circadian clock KaiB family protein [Leptolyngbya ohadii]
MGNQTPVRSLQSLRPDQTLFKGIALFTPGGDLIYCIDTDKQSYWHLQLCAVLQELLGLPEPPHFLVPAYTATIDRWWDAQSQSVRTVAEASPFLLRHQSLLNALFGISNVVWEVAPCPEELCDPSVLQSYRKQFPQLWQDHDLLVRFEKAKPLSPNPTVSVPLSWSSSQSEASQLPEHSTEQAQGYVFRLFVSGTTRGTERILKELHQLLEQMLQRSYTLKIVDIHRHPELAEADQISATPTLVRVWPRPVRRIVGDLANASQLLQALIVTDWSE